MKIQAGELVEIFWQLIFILIHNREVYHDDFAEKVLICSCGNFEEGIKRGSKVQRAKSIAIGEIEHLPKAEMVKSKVYSFLKKGLVINCRH